MSLWLSSASFSRPRDRAAAWGILIALAVPAWIWGGAHHDWTPVVWLSGVAAWGALVFAYRSEGRGAELARDLLADRLFRVGVAWVLLLTLRSLNAWWPERVDAAANPDWFSGRPPMPWLPSSVTRAEAAIHAAGWFNALAVLMLARHGFTNRRDVRRTHGLLLMHIALLAMFGFVQYLSGTPAIYWTVDAVRHFFASFYYENHAGQYFYLGLALAIGYALYYVCSHGRRPSRHLMLALGSLVVILYLAGVFSLSRTAIVASTLLVAAGAAYLATHAPSYLTPVARLYMLSGIAAACLSGVVLASGTLGEDIREDFARARPGQSLLEQAMESRRWQWEASVRIWQAHPVWGIGTSGFRYYIPFYAPANRLRELPQDHAGQVHNDVLTVLSEQGIAGLALWLAMLGFALAPLVAALRAGAREWILFSAAGVALVVVHSLFDLPFLCPAVVALWAWMAASAGRYAGLPAEAARAST